MTKIERIGNKSTNRKKTRKFFFTKKRYSKRNSIELISNGEEFINSNLKLITKAQKFILLQTYIFEDDPTTRPIIEALMNQVRKGVEIFILIDAIGSRDFPQKTIEKMQSLGIYFELFSPMFSKKMEHIGRRIHSKLLCIDGTECLIGGINLSQKYNAPKDSPPWLDYSCWIQGEEVHNIIRKNLNLYAKYFPQFITKHLQSLSLNSLDSFQNNSLSHCLIKTNVNDYMRLKNDVYKSYLKAFGKSKKQIIIVATYFFPGKKVLRALTKAASRGVDVKLIFTAISDHPLERWSSKYLYSWLLKKNIKIYEWGESIVHGKLALIDNNWVTIGSYNHNFLSRFGNHELNVEVVNKNFAHIVQIEMNDILSKSTQITKDRWQIENHLKHQVYETLSYIFANFLILFSMLIIIRREEEVDFNLMD